MAQERTEQPWAVFFDALRNQVPYDGSQVAWRLSAYIVAVRDGRVLMVEPAWIERWELPGGEVEPTETLCAGARRECLEETGYGFRPDPPTPLYVGEEPFYDQGTASYRHSVILAFKGHIDSEPALSWQPDPAEVRRVAWMEPTSLTTTNTHSVQWPILRAAGLV